MMSRLVLKVVALLAAAAVMAVGLVVVFGNVRVEDAGTYRALFADVSGLMEGSEVRAAGVPVGRVSDVELTDSNAIMVTFTARRDVPVAISTRAAIRYKNLIGDRYLELSDGPGPPGRLEQDDVIPAAHTKPALDLDELYNGFAPLFEGLAPDQVNELSTALIGVFQGEGPAVRDLLASVGSLTGTVADRDEVIGRLIERLNTVLATVDERAPQLAGLIEQLQQLVSGLSADRDQIGDSVVRVGDLAGNVGSLLAQARPDLRGTIQQVDRLTGLVNSDRATVETTVQQLPEAYRQLSRLGSYGSFFQFYLCAVQVRMTGPDGGAVTTPWVSSGVGRCR